MNFPGDQSCTNTAWPNRVPDAAPGYSATEAIFSLSFSMISRCTPSESAQRPSNLERRAPFSSPNQFSLRYRTSFSNPEESMPAPPALSILRVYVVEYRCESTERASIFPDANETGYLPMTPKRAYVSTAVNRCDFQSGSEPMPETGHIRPMRSSISWGTMNGLCMQRYFSELSSMRFQAASSRGGRPVLPRTDITRSRSDMPGAETLPCDRTETLPCASSLAETDFLTAS